MTAMRVYSLDFSTFTCHTQSHAYDGILFVWSFSQFFHSHGATISAFDCSVTVCIESTKFYCDRNNLFIWHSNNLLLSAGTKTTKRKYLIYRSTCEWASRMCSAIGCESLNSWYVISVCVCVSTSVWRCNAVQCGCMCACGTNELWLLSPASRNEKLKCSFQYFLNERKRCAIQFWIQ